MRKKLDPRLRFLLDTLSLPQASAAEEGFPPPAGEAPVIEVLVRCATEANLENLEQAGLRVHATTRGAHTVLAGVIRVDALPALAALPSVREVEFPRLMQADLDLSRVATGVDKIQSEVTGPRGTGVVVGVVDSGIDFTHPGFRHSDGSSRILFLWDQGAPVAVGPVPYGREYTKSELDQALAASDPGSMVSHQDVLGHGTHVAGIAAGNDAGGSEGFLGIAPEADLIVVSYASEGVTLGRSNRALAAVAYIQDRAGRRPVSINISQGMNGGGHCGETILETGIDDLLRRPGIVVVKSAGNETGWQIHAGGKIGSDQTLSIEIRFEANNHVDDIIEVWFAGEDPIDVAVQAPGGVRSEFVQPGDEHFLQTSAGNQVALSSDLDAADTGDTRVTLIFSRGEAPFLQPGIWKILLRSGQVADGRYDAWIERTSRELGSGEQARFTAGSMDESRTISIPGTAKRLITVGSYVTRPNLGEEALKGLASRFSSRGPTRYGLLKPELVAPGEWIIAARSKASPLPEEPDSLHTVLAGTSMAAPHVTGAAALVLSVRSDLHCEQVKQILMRSTRRDDFTSGAPDGIWGDGKLDIGRALKLARQVHFPIIVDVQIAGTVVRWRTKGPSTGAVRFHNHQRQLELGKSSGSEADLVLSTEHAIDLSARLKPGVTYFCEIIAFDPNSWWAVDDAGGSFYRISLP